METKHDAKGKILYAFYCILRFGREKREARMAGELHFDGAKDRKSWRPMRLLGLELCHPAKVDG